MAIDLDMDPAWLHDPHSAFQYFLFTPNTELMQPPPTTTGFSTYIGITDVYSESYIDPDVV